MLIRSSSPSQAFHRSFQNCIAFLPGFLLCKLHRVLTNRENVLTICPPLQHSFHFPLPHLTRPGPPSCKFKSASPLSLIAFIHFASTFSGSACFSSTFISGAFPLRLSFLHHWFTGKSLFAD